MFRRCDYLVNGEPDRFSTLTPIDQRFIVDQDSYDRHREFEKRFREVDIKETHQLMSHGEIGLDNKEYEVENPLLGERYVV